MTYFLDLFSPETQDRFSASDRSVSGFRIRHRAMAARVRPGDVLVCYLTRLSRWTGLLRVETPAFEDASPRFAAQGDPFVVRFKVTPVVWLSPDAGIPIHDDAVWTRLSVTRNHPKTGSTWTGFFRTSLNRLSDEDGAFLEQLLLEQQRQPQPFPLTPEDRRALAQRVVRRAEGAIAVSVPDDADPSEDHPAREVRESIRIQALLARIGGTMGLKIWVPANDRAAVVRELAGDANSFVSELPLNYDETTLDTIERIDVLWLKGRSIVRAFEVEHTTAIYSGILRMADLLSLQPNMDIRLHIVAPETRRGKVLDEIRRPVFSLLERRPLSKTCTFLSYDSIREIGELPHLAHVSDSILDEYAEEAE